VVLDVRRGDGPKAAFDYTFASIAATDALIARDKNAAAAAVRAVVNTQRALREDVTLATRVGEKLFPPEQAALIAELIRRDLPYYDAAISPRTVAAVNRFAQDLGLLSGPAPYETVVAADLAALW
jgi:ABC-type nitrate/sulfonate/bicarbonate transport system substrate-binding protein